MTADLLAGLLAGLAVALPIGPIGSYLIALAARERFGIAAAAALGVATTDGAYALLAGLGIGWVQRLMGTIGQPLRWLAAAVLVGLATRTVVFAVRRFRSPRPATEAQHDPAGGSQERPRASLTHVGASPWRTYAMLVGLTAVNPSTVATFGAIVVGHRLTGSPLWLAATGFALAAFAASAAWQLTLVTGGSVLGRLLSGPRGQLAVASVSALLMVALAVASLAR